MINRFIQRVIALLVVIIHWPVIEPLLELASLQRVWELIGGTVGGVVVAKWFPDSKPEIQILVFLVVMAVTLSLFYSLHKEKMAETDLLKAAQNAVSSLPSTPAGYSAEVVDMAIKTLIQMASKPPETPAAPPAPVAESLAG